jgi:hypothetical protein
MTRILSELLGTRQPHFGMQLQQIEDANGMPSTDIRLTSEIVQRTLVKLKELGLDPQDTTGQELYAVLRSRLRDDEAQFKAALQKVAPNVTDPIALVAHGLRALPLNQHCFSMKAIAAKRLLKAQPPKRTLKLLGYRSLESMLKHEPVQLIFTAAWLSESELWVKRLLKSYRKLSAHDFEIRPLKIEQPSSARWQEFGATTTAKLRHNVFSFKELGAVVILPLSKDAVSQPPYPALTTAVFALHAINDIHATSTFLKLHQVKMDFGRIVEKVIIGEPVVSSRMFDKSVPWHIIQQYYARMRGQVDIEIFEPHLQAEDLAWLSVEQALKSLSPALRFWEGTTDLGMLHDHSPVSFNLTDVLLSHSNALPYEKRLNGYLQQSLWHELMVRYFKHERVEHAVFEQLEPELVTVPAS